MNLEKYRVISKRGRIIALLGKIRKLSPIHSIPDADAVLAAELERLALLSPHLLADVGMHKDAESADSPLKVWWRDDLPISVRVEKRTCRVHIQYYQFSQWSLP